MLGPGVLETLRGHDFPGNVRELRNEIERLYATCGPGAEIAAEALSPRLRRADPWTAGGYTDAVRTFKLRLVQGALARSGGSRSAAARELGLHPSNLIRMIRELGIDLPAAAGRPPGGAPGRTPGKRTGAP